MTQSSPSRLANAALQWDEFNRPRSAVYGDIYYSSADALGESSHVFLQGNQLEARFAQMEMCAFTVAELGFGAGLNFLNTCRLWCRNAPSGATLHYLGCELHPLASDDMQRIHALWPDLAAFSSALLQSYPDHTAGVHQLTLKFDQHTVCLTLLYGDAGNMLRRIRKAEGRIVDAWFLDGFSPRLNPALWGQDLLQVLASMSKPGSTLTSYSVAGSFRSALQAAGYCVEKLPGYAAKRHMLRACLPSAETSKPYTAVERSVRNKGTVCVLGGGLAGCSTARALAQSGWQVVLLERNGALAREGSGNPQGILHCKPGRLDTLVNQFDLHGYLHAARYYGELARTERLQWQPCGMLQVGVTDVLRKRYRLIAESGHYPRQVLQYLDADAASRLAGVQLRDAALYFPGSGWLSPPALCALYVQHPNITVMCDTEAVALEQSSRGWRIQVQKQNGPAALDVEKLVLCNSADVHRFGQTRHYPLVSNLGQVDVYPAATAALPRLILCGQGYVLPEGSGLQSTGGSYFVGDKGEVASRQRRVGHLAQLHQISDALDVRLAEAEPQQMRIGSRAVLPDRMPLTGPVSSPADEGGDIYPGLYINTGHGSHGLTRTPICAAWLASELNGTVAPLPHELIALIAPQRYSA